MSLKKVGGGTKKNKKLDLMETKKRISASWVFLIFFMFCRYHFSFRICCTVLVCRAVILISVGIQKKLY